MSAQDEAAAIEFQRLGQTPIAMARDATLVRRNLGNFARIPG